MSTNTDSLYDLIAQASSILQCIEADADLSPLFRCRHAYGLLVDLYDSIVSSGHFSRYLPGMERTLTELLRATHLDGTIPDSAKHSLTSFIEGCQTDKTEHLVMEFIISICADRPPSHSIDHMTKVRDNAIWIRRKLLDNRRNEEKPEEVLRLRCPFPSKFDVVLVALLHDVADHKYDHDGSLEAKVRDFLLTNGFNPSPIIDCINAISFSKERQLGRRWFERKLSPYWVTVRDIVSDADKLEALGSEGGIRCMQYAEENGADQSHTVLHLVQHMHDKLLLLRDQYIVTQPGKDMARPLHDQLVQFTLNEVLSVLNVLSCP